MNIELIGQMIRDKRKAQKLTLLQVSRETGIAVGYLSKIENGKHTPSITILNKISEVVHLDVSMLSAQLGNEQRTPKQVDLLKEVWTSESLIFNGEEIPITDEVAYRLEMAINMGVAWAKEILNQK